MMGWLLLACATPDVVAPARSIEPTEVKSPASDDCVAKCLQANMARAVDHTVIEADCKAACKDEKNERKTPSLD